jgi:hypothetical protein
MISFASPWILAPLSVVAYIAGWLGCAVWWTRSQVKRYVARRPHASLYEISKERMAGARFNCALAAFWPLSFCVYLALFTVEYTPLLVAAWSRHPLEQQDLREVRGRPR